MTAPSNDDFANREALAGGTYDSSFAPRTTWRYSPILSIADATLESGEPLASGNVDRSAWFTWTCPVGFTTIDGYCHIRMAEASSNFNPILGVYTGTGFGDATLVVASDAAFGGAANCFFVPTEGETYLIQAGAPSDLSSGSTYRLFYDSPEPSPWPIKVVDSDGTAYRVGPDDNPDGGLARLVEADGTRWVQGYDAATTSLGSYVYRPASWSFSGAPDGTWSDDGATSLDESDDGLGVRFTRPAELDVVDANHVAYVDVAYDPPTPPSPGAVCTGVAVWQDRTLPTSGTVNWEFLSADGLTTYASDTGSLTHIFTSDSGEIADVAADGCIQRMHSGDVAEVTEWDRLWLVASWDGRAARPLSVVDADGTVLTRLPMTLDLGSAGAWLDGTDYWYADCGLWLGGDFTDMTGLPATLPTGADRFQFYVIDPGYDPGTVTFGTPFGNYWIYDAGGGTTGQNHFNNGTTPNAGSKFWVIFEGVNYDTSLDPMPSVDPYSLAPASLAQYGTA